MRINILKSVKVAACCLVAAVALSGCNASKEVIYMQNVSPDEVLRQAASKPITVQPGDEIMVYVSCGDAEMAARLSLISGSRRPEIKEGFMLTSSSAVILPYTVSTKGYISMPEIGEVHVAGLTRQQIAELVEQKIIDAKLVKDNSVNVTVAFANLTFSTVGEFNQVGNYSITKDNLTLFEAISISGDLTIYGRRDAVWVYRENPDGSRKSYCVDLRDPAFMQSPAYYVQQNDVIYVEPNAVRAGQSTLNENTFKSVGFWTSLASIAISVATLVVTLTR